MMDTLHRVLVTGSNGFVGRETCRHLHDLGFEVRPVVRNPESQVVLDLPAIAVGEICERTDWSSAVESVRTIVHLAAMVHRSNDTSSNRLASYRRVNTAGTLHLARSAARAGVSRFVFISSVAVNGDSYSAEVLREDDRPCPIDPYGLSKYEAELGLKAISEKTGMETVILRLPLVYGPGVKANFLRLMQLIDKGIPLPLGSIKNERSFLFLGNLVDAIHTCMTHPRAAGRMYLISDGCDVSTPELVRALVRFMGKFAGPVPFPPFFLRLGFGLLGRSKQAERLMESLVVDSSRIRSELGWSPPISFETGIQQTAMWFAKWKGMNCLT